jgi:tight adherence protein C
MANGVLLNNLTIGALAALGCLVLGLAWVAMTARNPNLRRVREIAAQQALQRAGRTGTTRRVRSASRGLMHRIVTGLRLVRTVRAQALAQRLAAAGWRGGDATIMFLFAKLVLPIALPVLTLLYTSTLAADSFGGVTRTLSTIVLGIFGFFLPDIWVSNVAKKRKAKIQLALPDALDLMVTCAEAGLSLEALLRRVSEEMQKAGPELAEELALTCIEIDFLPDRRQALTNLADRTDLPAIRALVNALQQSSKFGTPLSQAMRVLAAEFRDERIVKAEEKAARLPVLMTIPMVLFILPSLIMVLIGPAILRIFDALVKH